MPYSRKNLKAMFTLAEAMERLLDAKKSEELPTGVYHYIETARDYVGMAIADMEVEAGVHGREERERIQQFLPGFGVVSEEEVHEYLTNKQ